ncbi:MAG: PSD1 and planctomycete cytochrome C domain-containing protein [Isosphaeraceae bacterium]
MRTTRAIGERWRNEAGRLGWCLVVFAGVCISPGRPATAADASKPARVAFNRDIRPILSENCYACHGPDKNKRKARLRLDERASAVSSQAIVPGKPDESELLARILSDDADQVMPPPASHKSLTPSQKDLLRRWISEGAEYQAHWAYVPVQQVSPPPVKNASWVRNPIDAFILSTLESRGIAPSPEADRATLIRRLSLDLLGLPPTPEEVRAFEQDRDPRAYERLVDRLLESPHYGERMAVPWLDLVRFADTVGYHGDQGQRVFPYRDYVIDAFNRNKPFDQFTVEQLAGDLLPSPTSEQLVATCFNRLNMMTREGGAQPGEYLAKYASDRIRTVSMTWLGSTMGCCECHDHKYDPFTMRDFYSLGAFFADIKQWGVYSDYDYTPNPELKGWSNDHPFPPEVEVESPYLKKRKAQLQERIRQLCLTSASLSLKDRAGRDSLETWARSASAFVRTAPSGWKTPELVEANGAKREADGSLLINAPASGDSLTAVLKPGPGGLARIRVELLPHPSHGGRITRDRAESTTIRLSATVTARGGKPQPLSFFHADADRKSPRYFNGDEILGILGGWITARDKANVPQTAVWSLESPIDLKADDTLTITLSGRPGCVRISTSPFGFDPMNRPGLDEHQREALLAGDGERTPEHRAVIDELYAMAQGPRLPAWGEIKSLSAKLLECRDGRSYAMVVKSAPPRVTRVLPRGNWQDESGPIVEPAVPRFLPQPSTASAGKLTRLDLARWILAPDNPLTARVFMNRLWKQCFGTGISSLVEDVGAQGEWPVHPELLDWLAFRFRDGGWDVKRMVRLLVTSATYRQDARLRPELREIDPANRLLASQSPRRLEAEFVRDNALAIAGLLNPDVGGPSVFPYQPGGYYANLQFPDRDYIADTDDRQYRRGVYMHWQRTFLHPMLANFDAPPREECTAARNVANTPQQALTLLNDPSYVEAARVLARRLLTGRDSSDLDRVTLLFERALARSPGDKERQSLTAYLQEQRAFFRVHPSEAGQLVRVGQSPVPTDLSEPELAAWTMVCRVVLSLHETITRY